MSTKRTQKLFEVHQLYPVYIRINVTPNLNSCRLVWRCKTQNGTNYVSIRHSWILDLVIEHHDTDVFLFACTFVPWYSDKILVFLWNVCYYFWKKYKKYKRREFTKVSKVESCNIYIYRLLSTLYGWDMIFCNFL